MGKEEQQAMEGLGRILEEVRSRRPLVHHITNLVVTNVTANATLAIGALPVMAHAYEEVEEMVQAAGALLLNIGTLTPSTVESMVAAGRKANELGIPVVLDPVGAGATRLRLNSARRLLEELKLAVVRGNAAEIGILAGRGGEIKGVESLGATGDLKETAVSLALETGAVVAITGKQDILSDGRRLALVDNGHPMLGTVTGTGCMATTMIAAFAAVEKDYLVAAAGALACFGLAGERAAEGAEGPGSFQVALFDWLYRLRGEDLERGARVTMLDA